MIKKGSGSCGSLAAIIYLASLTLDAKPIENLPPAIEIPYVNDVAIIDGELNDNIWNKAKTIDLNLVNSPWNNKPSPVNTTAKIVENGEYLYVSFIAQDPQPEAIQASLGDRDTKWGDDLVIVKLDTSNTRRLSYQFMVNPLGVQMDAIGNEITGETNTTWDGMWQSYGKMTPSGYQIEMAIPYRILNFNGDDDIKTWAIELLRLYPRDSRLRISHMPLDRDDNCWLCQAPEIKGFKQAKPGKKFMLTPAVVAQKDQTRDVYDHQSDWRSNNETEAGLDIRWGINSNTLLNATINPDFSTVEADAGQLSINKTFALFYEEKRPFFTENADYFSSNFDLVYSRNIADPDYGAKLTGTQDNHSYGLFITNDTQTNFIVPGNTESSLVSLAEKSHASALTYRFDASEQLSLGAIGTLRESDSYHNYVFGVDGKFKFDESNSVNWQLLNSETLHQQTFSDNAYLLSYEHDSEYWGLEASHQHIGQNFRADLGYMPYADITQNSLEVSKNIYGNDDSFWQKATFSAQYALKQSNEGELLERINELSFHIDGPLLSLFDLTLRHNDKVGLRLDANNQAIDGNTNLFTENQATLHFDIQPSNKLYTAVDATFGKKIDYDNNRLGDFNEWSANITYNVTTHLEADLFYTRSNLEADNAEVYNATLVELRLNYQFNINSYLKLNVVYSDIDQNPLNNPLIDVSQRNVDLSSQLVYAYKINPQTVFYLGYSDFSYRDDALSSLKRSERTLFTKISYAWLP